MPFLIDTHTHVNFKAYKDDADEVIKRALNKDIWLFNVGSQSTTSKRAVLYANKYKEGVYAIIGLHPIHVVGDVVEEVKIEGKDLSFKTRQEDFEEDFYQELANNNKVIGIGECGLDYYRLNELGANIQKIKEKQHIALEQQILFAYKNKLPLMFHTRLAMKDMQAVIKKYATEIQEIGAVMHCFQGSKDDARFCLEHNIRIGLNGLITFARDWDEAIVWMPIDNIVLETDAPYLTPVPYRGKRNEPLYVQYVAEKLAELKNMPVEEIAEITTENAKKLFKL